MFITLYINFISAVDFWAYKMILSSRHVKEPLAYFKLKMSYRYWRYFWGDKTILWLSDFHNSISYAGKTVSWYQKGPMWYFMLTVYFSSSQQNSCMTRWCVGSAWTKMSGRVMVCSCSRMLKLRWLVKSCRGVSRASTRETVSSAVEVRKYGQ